MESRRLVIPVGVAAGVVTVTVVALPFIRLAYRQPGLHVMIDTTVGVVSLLAAYLVFGRFEARGSRRDWVLATSLAIGGLTDLLLLALPAAISDLSPAFATWAPASGRVVAALGFAFAALSPERRWRPTPADARRVIGVAVLVVVVLAGVFELVGSRLPAGIDPSEPVSGTVPDLDAHPAVLAVQLVAMALFAAATVGFARRAAAEDDDFLAWVAASMLLSTFARLHYALFPSLYSDWISTGDLLRLGSRLLLLVGAFREISRYWSETAAAAASEERRRVARDLHDGLAHELALLLHQARGVVGRTGDPDDARLAHAAERAFDESRMAIAALAARPGETLDAAVIRTAEDLAHRLGVRADLDIDEVVGDTATTTALVRIVREAIVNAAHHGRAATIRVVLKDDQGLRLRVVDDGDGFDGDGREGNGLGIVSMRERVQALGGTFAIRSEVGSGAAVDIWVPRR